jgi:hypothetical protein
MNTFEKRLTRSDTLASFNAMFDYAPEIDELLSDNAEDTEDVLGAMDSPEKHIPRKVSSSSVGPLLEPCFCTEQEMELFDDIMNQIECRNPAMSKKILVAKSRPLHLILLNGEARSMSQFFYQQLNHKPLLVYPERTSSLQAKVIPSRNPKEYFRIVPKEPSSDI